MYMYYELYIQHNSQSKYWDFYLFIRVQDINIVVSDFFFVFENLIIFLFHLFTKNVEYLFFRITPDLKQKYFYLNTLLGKVLWLT